MKQQHGFSLLELSIVLVIIGLIAGGIVAGSSMIRAAELRKVTVQLSQIKVAVHTFRDKYFALPGDMKNATAFWGTSADCFAAAVGTTTCDGDGSGKLAYVALADTSNAEYEPWHFWKQLSNAGLITGVYSGFSDNSLCGASNYCIDSGVNAMEGPFNSSGWMAFSLTTSADLNWQGKASNRERNIISLVNPANSGNNIWIGASLSAQEAWNVDTKNDDGKPYTGKMVDSSGIGTAYTLNCASVNSNEFGTTPAGTTTNDATYLVDRTAISTTEGCLPFFDLN